MSESSNPSSPQHQTGGPEVFVCGGCGFISEGSSTHDCPDPAKAFLEETMNKRAKELGISRDDLDRKVDDWRGPESPAQHQSSGPSIRNLSEVDVGALLSHSLKPEEISGEQRELRIRELLRWFSRLTRQMANPKWTVSHAYELAYYIATSPPPAASPSSLGSPPPDKPLSGYDTDAEKRQQYWRQQAKAETERRGFMEGALQWLWRTRECFARKYDTGEVVAAICDALTREGQTAWPGDGTSCVEQMIRLQWERAEKAEAEVAKLATELRGRDRANAIDHSGSPPALKELGELLQRYASAVLEVALADMQDDRHGLDFGIEAIPRAAHGSGASCDECDERVNALRRIRARITGDLASAAQREVSALAAIESFVASREEEIERLREDAVRLDWVIEKGAKIDDSNSAAEDGEAWVCRYRTFHTSFQGEMHFFYGATARAAIDKARISQSEYPEEKK